MDEYVSKQEAVDYCKALMNAELVQHTNDWGYGKERYNQTEVILNFIENRQPADVVPVVHGRWEHGKCNLCGEHAPYWCLATTYHESMYCPNCGAKMDGGNEA